ncbi:MAG: hypothetical protein ACOCYE_00595 [Pseudomonadota bacterium]
MQATQIFEILESQAKDRIEVWLQGQFEDEAFVQELTRNVTRAINEQGGLQIALSQQALERAREPQTPAAIRALGLQLFAMLHGGELRSDVQLRATFVDLVRAEAARLEGDQGPASNDPTAWIFLDDIFRYYPMGQRGDSECAGAPGDCDAWDAAFLEAALHVLRGMDDAALTERGTPYRAMLDRVLNPALIDRALNWTLDHPATPAARQILLLWSENVQPGAGPAVRARLSKTLLRLADLLGPSGSPARHSLAIDVLARLHPQAPASFVERARVMEALWQTIPADERSRLAADLSCVRTEAPPTMRAACRLVRTDRAHEAEDWEYIVRGPLTGGANGASAAALRLWVERLRLDHAAGLAVDAAGDRGLREVAVRPGRDEPVWEAAAIAVAHASETALDAFAAGLPGYWTATPAARRTLAAVTDRDAARVEPYALARGWLQATSREAGREQRVTPGFRNELLAALIGVPAGTDDLFRPMAAAVRDAVEANRPESDELAVLLLDEMQRSLERQTPGSESYWTLVGALEDSGALAAGRLPPTGELGKQLLAVKGFTPWIGTPVGDDRPLTADGDAHELAPVSAATANAWHVLDLEQGSVVALELAEQAADTPEAKPEEEGDSVQLVIADVERRAFSTRVTAKAGGVPAAAWLEPGRYALQVRAFGAAPSVSVSYRVRTGFPPSTERTAHALPATPEGPNDLLLLAGPEGGAFWFEVELSAGERLIATTRQGAAPEAVDTVLRLFDADRGVLLAEDDDGGGDLYSRLEYHGGMAERLLLAAVPFGEEMFPADAQLQLRIDIDRYEALPAATTQANPAWLAVGTEGWFEDAEATHWVRFGTEDDEVLVVRSNMAVRLWQADGSPAAAFSAFVGETTSEETILVVAERGRNYMAELRPGLGPAGGMAGSWLRLEYAAIPLERTRSGSTASLDGPAVLLVPATGSRARIASHDADAVEILFDAKGAAGLPVLDAVDVATSREVPLEVESRGDGWHVARWPVDPDGTYDLRLSPPGGVAQPMMLGFGFTGLAPHHGIAVGDRVILGRHQWIRDWTYWNDEMEPFVGCLATVEELSGRDPIGAQLAHVDLDQWAWRWRLRDMEPAPPSAVQPARCLELAP